LKGQVSEVKERKRDYNFKDDSDWDINDEEEEVEEPVNFQL